MYTGNQTSYENLSENMKKKFEELKIPIVNDLTTGGVDKAVSAEAIKELKAIVEEKANVTSLEALQTTTTEHLAEIATKDKLGHVKVGQNLTITADGTLNASGGTVPDASTTVKGIVMLESSLNSTSTTKATTPYTVKIVNDTVTYLDSKFSSLEAEKSLTLVNGWSGTTRYYKEPNGVVNLFVSIYSGTKTAGTIIGVLPVGYRPPYVSTNFVGFDYNLIYVDNVAVPIRVEITSQGEVKIAQAIKEDFYLRVRFRTV